MFLSSDLDVKDPVEQTLYWLWSSHDFTFFYSLSDTNKKLISVFIHVCFKSISEQLIMQKKTIIAPQIVLNKSRYINKKHLLFLSFEFLYYILYINLCVYIYIYIYSGYLYKNPNISV